MARGRIAAIGSVAQIRDRLDDHPLTIRMDVAHGEGPKAADRRRELAGALLLLPDVVGVELLEDEPGEVGVGRLLVRARNPRTFFQDLARLVLEGWYEVRRLQTLDESAQAVLGYLLGGGA